MQCARVANVDYGLIKILVTFGGVVAFLAWQIYKVSKDLEDD